MPDIFPKNNWKPAQRPAAGGPARRWLMAQRLEALAPKKITPRMIAAMQKIGPPRTARPTEIPASAVPPPTKVFRTSVGEAPERIQRSESQPQNVAKQAPSR